MKTTKNMRLLWGISLIPSFFSCSNLDNIVETDIINKSECNVIIEATQEYHIDTRTVLQEDGSVFWKPNDAISLFFLQGNNGGNKFVSQNTEVAKIAEFTGTINGITGGGEDIAEDAYFWATYPYSKQNVCENNSLVVTLPNQQVGIEDTFNNNTFITVARSTTVKMGFKNVCGGLSFCVSQDGIKSISFRGNNNEVLAGKVRVEFNEHNTPFVSEVIDGQNEVTLIAPNGGEFEVGKFYYLITLPTSLNNGFSMTFNKKDATTGTYTRTKGVEIVRSRFGVVRNLDAEVTFQKNDNNGENVIGGSESGFYLGIIGFNADLYPYPISRLTNESVQHIHSFIDNLSISDGTLLYYATDKSLDELHASSFPSNLYNVAVITFTDGLDRISLDRCEIDKGITYLTNNEYLETIHTRLSSETIVGQTISAYTIGVQGDDVTNTTTFKNNLNKLATSSDNVFEVNNMSEVTEKFTDIANKLGETKYVQTLKLTAAGPSHLALCRFTFDNVSNYSASKQYIEGTFNRLSKTLENITYVGLTSTSGNTVAGTRNTDGFYEYLFEGIQSENGELVSNQYVQHWYTDDGIWQKDSEFVFDPSNFSTKKIKRSAAILLNLDCSSSLGTEFPTLKAAAKSFVSQLYEKSIDPNEVSSITLNTSDITIASGCTATLTPTVLPTTAIDRRVEWFSTNTAVAKVDQNGVITAIGPGQATIIAQTIDGGLTASCKVSVVVLAQKITLNHTELELYNGDKFTLQAKVSPENASNKTVNYHSLNTNIATIDENGIITPLKAGTTTITASTIDGSNISSTCKLVVLQHVNSISLNNNSTHIEVGDTFTITATISPYNASNKNIEWISSNESVVVVDQKGICSALQAGEAIITATTEDQAHNATCHIKVSPINYELRKIYYTSTDGSIVIPNSTSGFGATIISNTYNNGQGVILFDGKVTAIGPEAFESRYTTSNLKSITIPETVISIERYAFFSCESLTTISLSKNICKIGSSAFAYCDGLTNFVIPNGVTVIESNTFAYCKNLRSLTIPSSVKTIHCFACSDSYKLTEIYCNATTPPTPIWSSGGDYWRAFEYNIENQRIYVPYSATHDIINEYKNTRGWSAYAEKFVENKNTE